MEQNTHIELMTIAAIWVSICSSIGGNERTNDELVGKGVTRDKTSEVLSYPLVEIWRGIQQQSLELVKIKWVYTEGRLNNLGIAYHERKIYSKQDGLRIQQIVS